MLACPETILSEKSWPKADVEWIPCYVSGSDTGFSSMPHLIGEDEVADETS